MKRYWGRGVIAIIVLALLAASSGSGPVAAQQPAASANIVVDSRLYDGLTFRSVGFSRGGRSTAVAGVPDDPLTYYFGSTGGGVWKTTDAGISWQPIADGAFEAGSIGAIAVAGSDPNVIYVGTGSACPRGNISPGVGMYKSTDAGKTWKHIGLRNAGQIGRVRVHPKNHDLVYVAVLGNMFGPSAERGVYRSKDGGQSWEKMLYVDERTGAVDLSMDVTNPRILYAAQWTTERKPWTIESGSLVGGIFKSTDGGDTWKKLTNGLPTDVLVGRIGVSVSPANPNRVWAQVEAASDRGGVYRSDNGGETWQRVNAQRMLQQRAWYYTHIIADPVSADTVYALNTGFYKSTDGGRTFQSYQVPHGDNHDLWINPHDNRIMINSNDGGANVSFTGATSWTDQMGQPTAEFYRITVDNRFPPRVYGAQQDNSTASVPSFGFGGGGGGGGGGGRGAGDFYAVGGGESGHIAVDARNPNVVFAGSYGGTISRVDVGLGLSESIRPYPDLETGQRAMDMKYRFQWNAPIRLSPHNSDVLYFTSQVVHRSRDQGKTWEVISPDLTTNDKSKQDFSGGEGITRDSTGVEVFCVIFAFEESAKVPGLLWAGSDDGLVHVSRDNGKTWNNITPADMPKTGTVNNIDLSAHDPGRVHISVYKYRENDFTPYIFQTNDSGKTWKKLATGTNGIPANHFVRVVKEDPVRKGLLYAGTEFGLYVSFDDGAHWQRFQLNLPVTPVTDIAFWGQGLFLSTQGRAFWALDDLSVLRQVKTGMEKSSVLFKPADAFRSGLGPAAINYYLAEAPKGPVRVDILDGNGGPVASFTGRPGAEEPPATGGPGGGGGGFGGGAAPRVGTKAGFNRFMWNMRYDALFEIPRGAVLWAAGGNAGPKVVPGRYQVKVTSGAWSQTQSFEVKPDPRIKTTAAEYEEQMKTAREVGGQVKELYANLAKIRDVKQQATQLGERVQRTGKGDDIAKAAKALSDRLTAVEGKLTQLQGEGGQDALNFPGQLDNQYLVLYGAVANPDSKPGPHHYQRFEELKPELTKNLGDLKQVLDADLAKFNELVRSKGLPAVILGS